MIISMGIFRPVPPERVPTIYIGDGEHTMVNITIRANPRPTTLWNVNGMTVIEGQSSGPYQAYYPRDMVSPETIPLWQFQYTNQCPLFLGFRKLPGTVEDQRANGADGDLRTNCHQRAGVASVRDQSEQTG